MATVPVMVGGILGEAGSQHGESAEEGEYGWRLEDALRRELVEMEAAQRGRRNDNTRLTLQISVGRAAMHRLLGDDGCWQRQAGCIAGLEKQVAALLAERDDSDDSSYRGVVCALLC